MKKEKSLVTNNLTDIKPYGPDAQPELLLGRGYTGHEHQAVSFWFLVLKY